MQKEKLLEEQEKEFEEISERQIFLLNGKKGTLKNTIIYDSLLNWHKQSLKQFIDGLVEREEKNIEKVRRELHDGMLFDESNWIDAKEETTAHLKEIRKQLEFEVVDNSNTEKK